MSQSSELFKRAQLSIVGGVNSPVRAFNGVGGDPIFFQSAHGAYVTDADSKRYVDYVGSWGPMILGHTHPEVIAAVQKVAANGLSFGAPTEIEILLAEKIKAIMPNIELLRMVSSGTEATMSAIRLARGFTGRDKIIKFEGCYHGHNDALLVKAGSGGLTFGVPNSAGVPASFVQHTLTANFNDLASVKHLFEVNQSQIAALILEPVVGNANFILPTQEFLTGLRQLCDEHQALLIFDEVMTGFRVALGGAQALYNIKPDLTTLGKVIGGGMPVGAFGGRRDIMEKLAPLGPVYQAGTLSGNPVAMTAGLATLNLITRPGFHDELAKKTQQVMQGLQSAANKAGIPFTTHHLPGMFGLYFTDKKEITNFTDVMSCDVARFKQFFHGMLQQGIYLAPSAFEAGFISIAHGDTEIAATIAAAEKVFATLA